MFEANHHNGYANVAWLLAKWMKRKGVGTHRENGLSAPTYCQALDVITLKELTGPNGRLIAEDTTPERMAHRKLYHTDRYDGLFEHMAGHYGYKIQDAYAPPGYDKEQQDDEE
ncbi:hypothetical protein Tco_0042547 [Tanacetum coccineum]